MFWAPSDAIRRPHLSFDDCLLFSAIKFSVSFVHAFEGKFCYDLLHSVDQLRELHHETHNIKGPYTSLGYTIHWQTQTVGEIEL